MKKITSVLVVLLVIISLVACAQKSDPVKEIPVPIEANDEIPTTIEPENFPDEPTTPPDFRNARWGMTKDEVIATENGQPNDQTDELMLYEGKEVAGLPASVIYTFSNGKLISGAYMIEKKHTNENKYIEDYNRLKKALISKYGEPTTDKMEWRDDLYKDDPSDYGFAISIGDLYYLTMWEVNKGRIGLFLNGDNFDISLMVIYQSPEAITGSQTLNTEGL